MKFFAVRKWLKYRLKAKSRHGTHSPFVYDFIEKVLRDNHKISLKEKLEYYFRNETIIFCDKSLQQQLIAQKNFSNDAVYVLPGIHRSKAQTQNWTELHRLHEVMMSIDIYHYGILVFNDAFKEKQHFIVR